MHGPRAGGTKLLIYYGKFGNTMSSRLNLEVLKGSKKSIHKKSCDSEDLVDDDKTSRFFKCVDEKDQENSRKQTASDSRTSTENHKMPSENDVSDSCGKNIWVPLNWEKQLDNIRQMRSRFPAPVDEMGCDHCADESAEPPVFRFQVLVALMLSSQTKDQVTFAAMKLLKQKGCTPQVISSMSDKELGNLIYPVGFWKRKTQYLKRTALILINDYNSDIPEDVDALCKLPGVGPKMAHICMQIAWNKTSGIGVDTHVHRISNRLKWVQKPTKSPEETRMALESWLPKKLWSEINYLLVGFGQTVCQPRNPKCSDCLNCMICPYAESKYQF